VPASGIAPATLVPGSRPGVRYRRTLNADGTSNICGVPVMGTLSANERGNKDAIDGAWLEDALRAARADERRGFLAPVKLTHADGLPHIAGFLRLTHVGVEDYDGVEMPTLFADLVAVDERTTAEIDAGRWPFRSVEIKGWETPRVSALALLAGDPPHFRFAVMAGTVLDETAVARFSAALLAAKCAIRLAAEGDEMPPKNDDKDASPQRDPGAADQASILAKLMNVLAKIAGKLGVSVGSEEEPVAQPVTDSKTGDEDDDKADAMGDHAEPDGDEDADESADTDMKDTPADDAEDPAPKGDKEQKMSATTPASKTTLDAATQSRFAALEGERDKLRADVADLTGKLSALTEKLSAKEKADAISAKVADARKSLAVERIIVPGDFDAVAAKFAAHGDDTLAAYVTSLRSVARRDPPETFSAAMAMAGAASDPLDASVEADLVKFASGKAAGTLEKARAAVAAEYVPLRRTLGASAYPYSVEQFLTNHFSATGVRV